MSRRPHGLLNAGPLADTLRGVYDTPGRNQPIDGIFRNLARGELKSVALIGLSCSPAIRLEELRTFLGASAGATSTAA